MNIPHKPVTKSKVVTQQNFERDASNVANVGEKLFRLTSESAGSDN